MHICQDEIFALFMALPFISYLGTKVRTWWHRAKFVWAHRHEKLLDDVAGCTHEAGHHHHKD